MCASCCCEENPVVTSHSCDRLPFVRSFVLAKRLRSLIFKKMLLRPTLAVIPRNGFTDGEVICLTQGASRARPACYREALERTFVRDWICSTTLHGDLQIDRFRITAAGLRFSPLCSNSYRHDDPSPAFSFNRFLPSTDTGWTGLLLPPPCFASDSL